MRRNIDEWGDLGIFPLMIYDGHQPSPFLSQVFPVQYSSIPHKHSIINVLRQKC
jgi:hypothetical protein